MVKSVNNKQPGLLHHLSALCTCTQTPWTPPGKDNQLSKGPPGREFPAPRGKAAASWSRSKCFQLSA
eukprot:746574-Hanusia_phi.AAC.5